MSDELKDQRVVTMMSPSELEQIDSWMFANRIRSRGEAIRRLCQMGLAFDAAAPSVEHDIAEMVDSARAAGEAYDRWKTDRDSIVDFTLAFRTASHVLMWGMSAVTQLGRVTEGRKTWISEETFEKAAEAAKLLRDPVSEEKKAAFKALRGKDVDQK